MVSLLHLCPPYLYAFWPCRDNPTARSSKKNRNRTLIRLRKSEVFVERISVCNVIEKFMEHSIHCLSCSYNNDVIDLLSQQLLRHIDFKVMQVIGMPFCQGI